MLSICNDGWPLLCDEIKISSFDRPKYAFALSQTVTRKSKVQYSTVCQGSDSSIRDILLIMCQMRSNRLNFHPIQSFYAIHTEESKSNHDSGIGARTCSGKYNAIERNSCGELWSGLVAILWHMRLRWVAGCILLTATTAAEIFSDGINSQ